MSTRLTLSRRELLLSLPALAVARRVLAQAGGPMLKAHGLHGMTLNVSDVKRSVDFYQGLFGMPIQARQGSSVVLRIGAGPQFLMLAPASGAPSISYLTIGVENFNPDDVVKVLAAHGIAKADGAGGGLSGGPGKVRVRTREGTPEVFFTDPEGILIQLQDVKYAGGSGRLGEVVKVEPSPSKGLIALKDMSHFTIFAGDATKANQFYKDLFGFGIRSYQGPTAPTLAIGPTVEFLMFTGGGAPARGGGAAPAPARPAAINHACMNLENFNVEQVQKALESVGIKPRAGNGAAGPMQHYVSLRMENRGGFKDGTPELYFTDPDGLLMQLQDVKYCGGGGYLGDVCPPVA